VQDLDALGTAIEAGTHLLLGVVPGTDAPLPAPKATASRVQGLWRELGFPGDRLAEAVTLTPACGLAGASQGYARAALGHVREAAKFLQPE
jgi:methionine synthase II (cobalamin-independent)